MTIIVFIAGFAFILIGVLYILSEIAIRRDSQIVTGEVVGFTSRVNTHKYNTSVSYQAVARFKHLDGQTYYAVSTTGSSSPLNNIGDPIPVYVRKSDLTFAAVESNSSFILGAFFSILGLFFVIVFINTYKVDLLSVGISAVVLLIIANYFRKALHKNPLTIHQWLKAKAKSKANSAYPENEKDQILWVTEEQIEAVFKRIRTSSRFVIPIFLLIGAVSLGFGLKYYKEKKFFIQSATHVEGTVVDMIQTRPSKRSRYTPVVEFSLPNSTEVHRFKDSLSMNKSAYEIGAKVDVIFDPSKPSRAEIYSGFRNYLLSLVLGGLGILFLYVAWHTNRSVKRMEQRRRTTPRPPTHLL